MRGKGRTTRPAPARARITPAYAGKRPPRRTGRCAGWDHPRVCGEKATETDRPVCWVGSPPCMRGKDHQTFQLVLRDGITPACAGKSRPCVVHVCRTEDHPRVCGEKALSTFSSLKNSGSPPHVRGKGECPQGTPSCCRITPACAGKSPNRILHDSHWQGSPPRMRGKVAAEHPRIPQVGDHPRVCGEKTKKIP